jgi:hypothetical protein
VRLGLEDRVPANRIAGIAAGLDHRERHAQIDDGVAGLPSFGQRYLGRHRNTKVADDERQWAWRTLTPPCVH